MKKTSMPVAPSRGMYLLAWEDDEDHEVFFLHEDRGFLICIDKTGKKVVARRHSLVKFEKLERSEIWKQL